MLDLIISTLTQGFIYAMLSYGIYITYKILDFPDLTVDGSFPLGAAVTALLLVKGVNPYLTLLAALAAGAAAGLCIKYDTIPAELEYEKLHQELKRQGLTF